MHRFETVSDVWKCTRYDYAHRVIEVAALHFVDNGNRFDIGRKSVRRGAVVLVGQGRHSFNCYCCVFYIRFNQQDQINGRFPLAQKHHENNNLQTVYTGSKNEFADAGRRSVETPVVRHKSGQFDCPGYGK